MKLSGPPRTTDKRRGRIVSPGDRGANHNRFHGPLERLLDSMLLAIRLVLNANGNAVDSDRLKLEVRVGPVRHAKM